MLRYVAAFLVVWEVFVGGAASAQGLDEAISQYRAENYEEALGILKAIPQDGPQASVAAYYLGLTYKQTGDLRQAAYYLERALRLSPRINDAYTELAAVLLSLGDVDGAGRIVDEAQGAGFQSGALTFLRGLVLTRHGETGRAREAFLAAKAMDPRLTARVDLQLAMLDVQERRFAAARQTLQALAKVAPDTEIGQFAREYDTALANMMDAHKTWRVTLGLQGQYDDNVILKPSNDIPGGISTQEDDWAMVGTFRAEYSPLLEGPWTFFGQLTATTVIHEHISTHDLTSTGLTLIPGRMLSPNTQVTLPVSATSAWLEGSHYSTTVGVRPTLLTTLTPGHLLQGWVGATRRELVEDALLDDENRDGVLGVAGLIYLKPFAGGAGLFSLGYELSRDETDGVNWRNTGHRGTASLLLPLVEKLSATASLDVQWQDFDGEHTVFATHRQDTTTTASLGLIWRPWDWGKITAQYTFVDAQSSIAIYEYQRYLYSLGIEATF